MNNLQHYKFLDDQCRLAVLPFKLNSVVYQIRFADEIVVRKKIRSIEFFADHCTLHFYDAGHAFDYEIGRSVFENKLDAERALEEYLQQQKKWTDKK